MRRHNHERTFSGETEKVISRVFGAINSAAMVDSAKALNMTEQEFIAFVTPHVISALTELQHLLATDSTLSLTEAIRTMSGKPR